MDSLINKRGIISAMDWKKIVLKKIKPTKKEADEIDKKISDFVAKLKKGVTGVDVVLGGSGAKGTWLSGAHDADVFVIFDYKKYVGKSHILSDILEKKLKKIFKYERLHGSRDYFQVKEEDFTFEIIPILELKNADEAANITDVSPLHTRWVRKNSNERLRDEIRLTKAFCMAQKCYGAESYINAFSGYVLEVLTVFYGSFEKLLKNAVKWEEKQIIDAGKLYGKIENVWLVLNKAKLDSPLIVIDPVDKARNAAAALSKDKWLLFKKTAAAFLKMPSVGFFEKREVSFEKLKKGKNHIVYVEVEGFRGKDDVAGAKLLKGFTFLKKELKAFGYVDGDWEWDKKNAMFWFFVKKNNKDKFELRKGPPLKMKKHVKNFKKKHKNAFEKSRNVWVKITVKDYKLKDFVMKKLKEDYFKEKVKKVNVVKVV